MNNNKSIFHLSINYRGNSKSKAKLNKQISAYTNKRLLSNPWEPSIDICLDTLNPQLQTSS